MMRQVEKVADKNEKNEEVEYTTISRELDELKAA
jgi:hypothetical protein